MKSQLTISRRDFLQSSAKAMAHSQIMMSVLAHASDKQALRLPVEGEIGSRRAGGEYGRFVNHEGIWLS